MKFNRKNFLDMLAMHQGNIDKKAINQIFSNIRLSFKDKKMKMTSTDGQRFLETIIETESNSNEDIFINGVLFYEVLKKCKGEDFTIKKNEESYSILAQKAEFNFVKKSKNDFPDWIGEYSYDLFINSQDFSNALKKIKWAMSSDEKRPYLQGVCINIKNDYIDFCATDGLRIGLQKIYKNNNFSKSWIISKKSILELIKILDECNEDVNLFLGKNIKLLAKSKKTDIVWQSLIVAGEFPAYEKVIPKSSISKLTINAKDFLEVVEKVMIMANQVQKIVTLNLSNESKITSDNALSSAEDIIPGKYDGEPMKILLNGAYLAEMLNNLNEEIEINFNGERLPISIKETANEEAIFILAPIKN